MDAQFIINLFNITKDILSSRNNVHAVEKLYNTSLPIDIHLLLSVKDHFLNVKSGGTIRILEVDEIMNATEELHVDFLGKNIVPLADLFDNNFLVFSCTTHNYKIMNITDESLFETYKAIYDFFNA